MRLLPTLALLGAVALLGACAATPGESAATASSSPPASSANPASGEPEAVTVDQLISDPQAYAGREVILTATAVREVAPSAWLVGPDAGAGSTVLMLDNDLHPEAIGEGETFEIHASVQQFADPESMSKQVGALPNMYGPALTDYQGSYVLVASDLTTSGA